MRLSFLLAFFACGPCINGMAGDNLPAGARSMALSHATVSFSDAWSPFHNQAGIAGVKSVTSAFFFESRYGIDELSLVAGSIIVPAAVGGFALSLFQFGTGAFRINKYAFAYARQLSPKWSAGLQIDYFSRLMPENERTTGFATFEAGILYQAGNNLSLGAHVCNPVNGGYDYPAGTIKMPLALRAGGHYTFDDAVLFAAEVQADSQEHASFCSGVEFYPAESLDMRIGISARPLRYTAGFGYRYRNISADIGFGYHGSLGITPAVSLQIGL